MIKAVDIVVGYQGQSLSPGVTGGGSVEPRGPVGEFCRATGIGIAGPLSFEYADGECVMLRGRNGSGKTTLMKTIAGLLKPLSGTIEIGGEALRPFDRSFDRPRTALRDRPAQDKAILVPTRIPKVKGFTVEDFIRSGMLAESGAFRRLDKEAEDRVAEAIRMMELNQLADKDLSRISDGEFQKACIASALTRKANVLMLDEPTAFLDVENRVMVLRTIQRLAHETGTTVIFSTHDIHDGALYSDSVLVL